MEEASPLEGALRSVRCDEVIVFVFCPENRWLSDHGQPGFFTETGGRFVDPVGEEEGVDRAEWRFNGGIRVYGWGR